MQSRFDVGVNPDAQLLVMARLQNPSHRAEQVPAQTFPTHGPDAQVPQFSVPPQPSEMDPQFLPCAAQVVGVQQTPAVVQ